MSKKTGAASLEFPDVIARGGFDCILGNPPYLGGRNITVRQGFRFSAWLRSAFPSVAGNCDLAAAFLLRGFYLAHPGGAVAFLTTNSIAQGDTRRAGLEVVLKEGGVVLFAVPSRKWPGRAVVDVAQFSVAKTRLFAEPVLNGRRVRFINSFFEADEPDKDAIPLAENAGVAFKGSEPAETLMVDAISARQLVDGDARNSEVVRPYLNGDDFYSSPTQTARRFVIDFHNWPEEVARRYEMPFRYAETFAKAAWEASTDQSGSDRWWWHRRRAERLYATLRVKGTGVAVGFTSKIGKFETVCPGVVFSNQMVVVCDPRAEVHAVLDSTIHEVWAWKFGSTMKTGHLRYTPSSVFQTYPFPTSLPVFSAPSVAAIGQRYHEHRKSLMLSLWLGLTDIYNLFHARDLSPAKVAKVSKKPAAEAERGYQGLLELRRLHRDLDLNVRDAYGWQNLDLAHDFHEVDTLPENDRVRYTISPAARKEVLRRLLALNHTRAAEEAAKAPRKNEGRRRKSQDRDAEGDLFA